jgi:hypothetical protein
MRKHHDLTERSSLCSSANTRRHVAEALGVAAIGCAGVAVYLYLRSNNERHAGARCARALVVAGRKRAWRAG